VSPKVEILAELGETALLLPQLINRALAANDRIKYVLTLFQSARDHADHPNTAPSSLQRERLASGVDDASFDTVVSSTSRDTGSVLHMPQAARLHALVVEGLVEMLDPLKSVASADSDKNELYGRYKERFDRLVASAPSLENDRVSAAYINAMTHGRGDQDGFHVLVMDLHRELNQLQRRVASESVEGADVYGIADTDRRLVAAFMAGVNATSFLKFDHPGLNTTATRAGDRLMIQNDIGTTDSHVLVLHVTGLNLTVTYTDLHRTRLTFFQALLQPVGFEWSVTSSQTPSAAYQLSVGQVASQSDVELERRLTTIGSRLVFLIDWNRARKRLSRFVKKSDAIEVLKWAADHEMGHRAFLQMGDVRLVYTAMERVARAQIRIGARLDELLGRESARTFLEAVLRLTAEGLRDRKSVRLIQDEIHAQLITHFQSSEQGVLALATDHATLVVGLAGLVRDALGCTGAEADPNEVRRLASRAKAWESRADQIVSRSRTVVEQASGGGVLARLLGEADDVADGLEEAAFLLTLGPAAHASETCLDSLRGLADLITSGAQGYVKCLEAARDAHHLGTHDDVEDLLVAVDAVIAFEHQSDERERTVKADLLDVTHDFRELHVLSEVAGCLADAADGLARSALIVRDYVLEALNVR
jgi:uncharacterized protein Yka (UPF0111/DUF47 family)